MSKDLFEEGGPLNIKRIDEEKVSMEVRFPAGPDGRVARECPNDECCPGYFKVKSGTGITAGLVQAYCPYCRFSAEPVEFTTKEQKKYAVELVGAEMTERIEQMFEDTFSRHRPNPAKSGGLEIRYTRGPKPVVPRPFEEEVRRDVICPNCGLDHSVFGLAIWCPDCGKDIFLNHIESEISVLRSMLGDIERRRSLLGDRVAAKDLENGLEDAVSIFEAVLRLEVRRLLNLRGDSKEEIDSYLIKAKNAFQGISRAREIFFKELNINLLDTLSDVESVYLENTFQKRHPITHNLGIVDKKYIDRVRAAEKEGRDILITPEEIETAILLSLKLFRSVHSIESVSKPA